MEKYKSEGKSVVYIDESGFSHESTRSHGYAKIGERCFSQFNWGAKGRTNAIGALLNGAILTISLFSFNVNSDVFYAWMTQDLLPKVPVGSVIVMDNASFHKREDISTHRLYCRQLPPYSPDFNPIEHTWTQLKSIRNKIKCSIDELFSCSIIGHLFIAR